MKWPRAAISSALPAAGGPGLLPVDTTSESTAHSSWTLSIPCPPPFSRDSLRHRHGDRCLIDLLSGQRGRKRNPIPAVTAEGDLQEHRGPCAENGLSRSGHVEMRRGPTSALRRQNHPSAKTMAKETSTFSGFLAAVLSLPPCFHRDTRPHKQDKTHLYPPLLRTDGGQGLDCVLW